MKVEWVPLGEVLRMERAPIDLVAGDTYRRIGIFSWGKGMLRREPASVTEMGSMKYFSFPIPSLIFSNIQAWEGAVALAGTADAGHVCSSRFYPYVPKVGADVDLTYLLEFFRSEDGLALMRRASPGTQVRNKVLSRAALEAARIPLASRPDQDRIAAHLGALPTSTTSARVDHLLELTQRDWAGDDLVVSDVLEPVTRRERPAAESVYPMQGVKWYGEGLFTRELRAGSELRGAVFRIEPGDLVYNRLFAWKQSFALATVVGWASNEFPTFRVRTDRVRPRVLLAAFLSPKFTAAVNAASTGSTPTSRNRLKERDFLGLPITIPRPREQAAIEASLQVIDRIKPLAKRAEELARAVLPAARNEIFSAMR